MLIEFWDLKQKSLFISFSQPKCDSSILELNFFSDVCLNLCKGNSYLLHGISVTNGYAAVVLGIKIVGNAEGCTDLVLTAVSLADRACLVKLNGELLSKIIVKFKSLLGKLLGKRKNCTLNGGESGMKMKHVTNVATLKLLLVICLNKECKSNSVCTKRGLDYVGDVMLVE